MTEATEGATDAATETPPLSQEPTTFGERLRQLRTTLGLSAPDYAQRLGVCTKTLYRWQQLEAPRPRMLLAVEAAFPEVSRTWLRRGKDPVFSSAAPCSMPASGGHAEPEEPPSAPACFGRRLRALRQLLGLSAGEFAQRLSISRRTLDRWDKLAGPRPSALRAVQATFPEVSAQWLARGEGPVFSTAPVEEKTAPVPGDPRGLEERGRSVCLSLEGPSGRVLARVDMVLMGSSQPLQVPVSVSEPS